MVAVVDSPQSGANLAPTNSDLTSPKDAGNLSVQGQLPDPVFSATNVPDDYRVGGSGANAGSLDSSNEAKYSTALVLLAASGEQTISDSSGTPHTFTLSDANKQRLSVAQSLRANGHVAAAEFIEQQVASDVLKEAAVPSDFTLQEYGSDGVTLKPGTSPVQVVSHTDISSAQAQQLGADALTEMLSSTGDSYTPQDILQIGQFLNAAGLLTAGEATQINNLTTSLGNTHLTPDHAKTVFVQFASVVKEAVNNLVSTSGIPSSVDSSSTDGTTSDQQPATSSAADQLSASGVGTISSVLKTFDVSAHIDDVVLYKGFAIQARGEALSDLVTLTTGTTDPQKIADASQYYFKVQNVISRLMTALQTAAG